MKDRSFKSFKESRNNDHITKEKTNENYLGILRSNIEICNISIQQLIESKKIDKNTTDMIKSLILQKSKLIEEYAIKIK